MVGMSFPIGRDWGAELHMKLGSESMLAVILKTLILTTQPTLTLLKVSFFQCHDIFRSILIILRQHNEVNQALIAWSL